MTTMTPRNLIPLALIAAALAGCADTGPPDQAGNGPVDKVAGKSCFYARNISSWAPQDDSTVNLRVNVNDYYQLKLLGPCNNINWDETIGLVTLEKVEVVHYGASGPRGA